MRLSFSLLCSSLFSSCLLGWPPSRLKDVFSFACQIKLAVTWSCNTGPSVLQIFAAAGQNQGNYILPWQSYTARCASYGRKLSFFNIFWYLQSQSFHSNIQAYLFIALLSENPYFYRQINLCFWFLVGYFCFFCSFKEKVTKTY